MNLYVTADQIGTPTGGGAVTYHESEALKGLGPCEVWDRDFFRKKAPAMVEAGFHPNHEPWGWDGAAVHRLMTDYKDEWPKLAHFYAGTFTDTADWLKHNGCKITYTAAAHDIDKSRKAHEDAGFSFDYPHLNTPDLWHRYVGGYLAADVVVCPSRHSADCMRRYGCQRVEIIPHGVDLPGQVAPLPKAFTVGYLGAVGPDKGVGVLLQAWGRLNYRDGSVLLLAGRDSQSAYVAGLIKRYVKAPQSICTLGWQNNVSDFYGMCCCYCQPSLTEGFGIEVLESLAHGRPVICSTGAGACDVITSECGVVFDAGDVMQLADRLDWYKKNPSIVDAHGRAGVGQARHYSWDKIRERYIDLWRKLI